VLISVSRWFACAAAVTNRPAHSPNTIAWTHGGRFVMNLANNTQII
jgi:hypothetical protein